MKLIPPPWKFDPPTNLRIVDVRTLDELALHADAWADLLLQSPVASPMLSYPQISAFLETQVPPSQAWICLFIYQGERMLGVLPLIAARAIGIPCFKVLFLKTPYDILHTGGVDCLTLNGREDVIEVMVKYISLMPRTWPLIRIREIPENSASMVCMKRPGAKLLAIQRVRGGENYIRIPATLEEFHGRLSSNFRRQLKRGKKKLDELEDVHFLCSEDSRTPEENMRRFEEVENAGWKGEGNSSIKANEANSKLYTFAAERFSKQGWMEWNFVEIGGKSIGAHYAVRIKRTLFLLKIGYDESFSAYSPGNLLLEQIIANACLLGDLDEINCVAECTWHKNWAMDKRELYDLLILPEVPVLSMLLGTILRSRSFHRLQQRFDRKPLTAIM